jgi:hypothetical protein
MGVVLGDRGDKREVGRACWNAVAQLCRKSLCWRTMERRQWLLEVVMEAAFSVRLQVKRNKKHRMRREASSYMSKIQA